MTPAELQEIRDTIWCEPWKDPQLFPDLLVHVFNRLGELATEPMAVLAPLCHPYPVQDADEAEEWATDLLREMYDRARSGVPFGEPYGDQPPTNPEDL